MPSSLDAAGLDARPRASVLGAFLEGWRRVLGAPASDDRDSRRRRSSQRCRSAWPFRTSSSAISARAWKRTLGVPVESIWAGEFGLQASPTGAHVHARDPRVWRNARGAQRPRSTPSRSIRPSRPSLPATSVCGCFLSGGILDRLARGRPRATVCLLRRLRRVLSSVHTPCRGDWTVLLAPVRQAAPVAVRHLVRPVDARSRRRAAGRRGACGALSLFVSAARGRQCRRPTSRRFARSSKIAGARSAPSARRSGSFVAGRRVCWGCTC